MVTIGFAVLWLGYQQAIYGWVLLKGYDIRWRDLANPLDPYQWPPVGQDTPKIPPGQILPGAAAKAKKMTTAQLAAKGGITTNATA
jgi:hypothetical protein